MPKRILSAEVWGEYACFSRPELKVERFTYPVITPSAARGIFDSIFVKPLEFRWEVRTIEVLAPPRYISLRRNEVKEVASTHAVQAWIRGRESPEPLWADGDRRSSGSDNRGRTQRQTTALRDVRYRLWAEISPWPGSEAKRSAFEQQWLRRLEGGKCFAQPYFGCREFPAYFSSATAQPPVDWSQDLGFVLYDVFDLARPGASTDRPRVSFFRAQVQAGVVSVPKYSSEEVIKPLGQGG